MTVQSRPGRSGPPKYDQDLRLVPRSACRCTGGDSQQDFPRLGFDTPPALHRRRCAQNANGDVSLSGSRTAGNDWARRTRKLTRHYYDKVTVNDEDINVPKAWSMAFGGYRSPRVETAFYAAATRILTG